MNVKKLILISVAVVFAVCIGLDLLTPEPKYSSNFTATYPETFPDMKDSLKRVDMLVDFSKSMRGFIDYSGISDTVGNSIFIRTVSDFLTDYESNFGGKSVVHCGNSEYDKDTFREKMRNKTIFNANTTELDKLIEKAVSSASDSSVSILLSDMVLSYGTKVIKASGDLDYNKNELGGLASAVKSHIVKIKGKGLDVMLFQYLCDFKGDYYCNYRENLTNVNSDKKQNRYNATLMKRRPFYFMLIGKKNYLVSLYDKCVKDTGFVYTSFNIEEYKDKSKEYNIAVDRKQYWTIGKDTIKDATGKAVAGTLCFFDKGNLQEGPETTINIEYNGFILPSFIPKKNINIKTTLGKINKTCYNAEDSTLKYSVQLPGTDSLKLKKENNVSISVRYNIDDGQNISVNDDININPDSLEGKTWGIKSVLDAIDGAYFGKTTRKECSVVSETELKIMKY